MKDILTALNDDFKQLGRGDYFLNLITRLT